MSFLVLAAKRRKRKGKLTTTKTTAVGPFTKRQADERLSKLYKKGYDVAIARVKITERKIHKRRKKRRR